ncbi:flagellar export protein FliJ [Halomonas huangheensis]|uniref:Flagellar FliJ protein n=1 Tax=Halomonas huangheensis TaxID=1178482 RepID=W1N5D4_9GAMM|nr:flagellar export protein FliJ [Halomonas huangheensis]ALM54236.1 flagellar export protein FliJ [Halomonas huangheensis]ERL50782.1 hypothetical protein BJB45_19495 [Halomonas huangheensis]
MTASSPLDTLLDLARTSRDQAGQRLAGSLDTEQQVSRQLESLENYRHEYAARLSDAMRQGVDPATLHNTQRFLASLDNALTNARQTLAEQHQKVQQAQHDWQQEQQRVRAYDTLTERRATAASRRAVRQEQRTSDELVNSRLLRQNTQSDVH